MPGKLRLKPDGPKVNVQEEHIGTATAEICYPRIQSCIAITTLGPHGITGAHVTFATEEHIIQEMLTRMAAKMPNVAYVVGGIGFYKTKTAVKSFNTRKKMQSKLKSMIPGLSTVYFYDTWQHSNDVNLGAIISIADNAVDFSWTQGVNVSWDATPDMSSYNPIPRESLVKR